jgi:hypothetical protein
MMVAQNIIATFLTSAYLLLTPPSLLTHHGTVERTCAVLRDQLPPTPSPRPRLCSLRRCRSIIHLRNLGAFLESTSCHRNGDAEGAHDAAERALVRQEVDKWTVAGCRAGIWRSWRRGMDTAQGQEKEV